MSKIKIVVIIVLIINLVCILGLGVYIMHNMNILDNIDIQLDKIADDASLTFTYAEKSENKADKNNYYTPKIEEPTDFFAFYEKDGIDFISYSPQWDEDKLIDLADELYQNKHGQEIYYLARIELHDQEEEDYSGLFDTVYETFPVNLSLYNFFPNELIIDFPSGLSVISLPNAGNRTTVKSMANVLSHEYGHHFTFYYFDLYYPTDTGKNEYYNLRNNDNYNIYLDYTDWDFMIKEHKWFLAELAADDYVYLMGSPTTHIVEEFYDSKEKVSQYARNPKDFSKNDYFYLASINLVPHENPYLKMPSQIEGLSEYYYSFINESSPEYTTVPDELDLNISFKRRSSTNYEITWDKPWEDEDVIYTLICYDDTGDLIAGIKSIKGNETSKAYIGKYTKTTSRYIYTYADGFTDLGELEFRVSITFPDSTVILSKEVKRSFE